MKHFHLLFVVIFFTSCLNGSDAENAKAPIEIEVQRASLDSVKHENDSLKAVIKKIRKQEGLHFPKALDTMQEPEAYVLKKMNERPELFPEKSVHGGTMRFVDIDLLNDRFIWAEFKDGHINGEALYSYKFTEEGEPEFKFLMKLKK